MSKIKKKSIIVIFVFLFSIFNMLNTNNVTIIESNKYLSANDDVVSTRELAMLASLVYEDVPNDVAYKINTNGGCVNSNGLLKNNCFFTANESEKVELKNSSYSIYKYIEGMSPRKANVIFSKALNVEIEEGQEYYYLDYADVSEMASSWSIYDYETGNPEKGNKTDAVSLNNYFDAITFKKGNNYVIAYRGTDFPDISEWIGNLEYAFEGENSQSQIAYDYAISVYKKIASENPNAKIYVTGHSLGAYLAQIGGAAIVEYELGYGDSSNCVLSKCGARRTPMKDYNEYETKAKKTTSKLQQVAYFNGMGVSGILAASNFTKNVGNALTYLSTNNLNGTIAATNRFVNYSDTIRSSGRLVLYSMGVDPVSDIGFHYGEIYKLEPGADAIANHRGTHKLDLAAIKEGLSNTVEFDDIKATIETLLEDAKFDVSDKDAVTAIWDSLVYTSQTIERIFSSDSDISSKASDEIIRRFDVNRFKTYGVASIATNVFSNLFEYAGVNLNSLKDVGGTIEGFVPKAFEYFNVNHETDSFLCLADSANGNISSEKIKLTIEPVNLSCNDGSDLSTCNISPNYYKVPTDYKIGDPVSEQKEKHTNYGYGYLLLKAEVKGGCAKSYRFTYKDSVGQMQYINIDPIIRNEIIIPYSIISSGVDEYNEALKTFGVEIVYGNKYASTTASVGKLNLVSYNVSNSIVANNPTGYVVDGYVGAMENKVTKTADIKVTNIYKPVCEMSPIMNVTLYKKSGLLGAFGSVEPVTKNIVVTCTSPTSKFTKTTVKISDENFRLDKPLYDNSVVFDDKAAYISLSDNGRTVKIIKPITIKNTSGNDVHVCFSIEGVTDQRGFNAKWDKASTCTLINRRKVEQ